MSNSAQTEGEKRKGQALERAPAWLQLVREQVDSLKYGTVQITIHDARVVQVERAEKLRFEKQSDG